MNEDAPVKKLMGELLQQMADAIDAGVLEKRVKVGLTTLGCEVGIDQWIHAAENLSQKSREIEVVLIGPRQHTGLLQFEADTEEEMHGKMEMMLDHGMIDVCITTHYAYPIGVASVGKMMAPGKGKEMLLATTSGTAAIERTPAMILNALYGIIVAKTLGYDNPSVGILNVEGARQVEKALVQLQKNGYPIRFAQSLRPESGCMMRGNDVIAGTADVFVQDSLTGNITMKMCASVLTGGEFESIGSGYGPGIGERYQRLIMVISRASGYTVVQNAIRYAYQMVKGDLRSIANKEFQAAGKAGLHTILRSDAASGELPNDVAAPLGEPVTKGIAGIDILELEKAVQEVWREGIYAESGMGCTGPILLVSEKNADRTLQLLETKGYLVQMDKECL